MEPNQEGDQNQSKEVKQGLNPVLKANSMFLSITH